MTLPQGTGRLAIVQRRDTLRIAEFGAEATTIPGRTRWPAWLEGGAILIRSCLGDGKSKQESQVVRTDVASLGDRTLYRAGAEDPPGIAPRVPHYVLPASRGERFAVVAATREGLALFLREADEEEGAPLLMGAPLFPCWDPSGRFLVIHTGPELLVIDTKTGEQFQPSAGDAVGFRTPAYSDDGEVLAYALSERGAVQLLFAQADGTGRQSGPRFDSGIIIDFQPGTQNCYVATMSSPETGLLDRLWKVTAGASEPQPVFGGPFVSFAWSPRGDRLVVVYPSQSGDGSFALYMLDPSGEVLGASEAIVPSEDQRTWITFFDQYGKSHTQWSRSGEYVFFSGRAGADRVPASLGDWQGNWIYAWSGNRGAPLECVMQGEFVVCG